MSNAAIKALIEERNKLRAMLQSVDAELANALGQWSKDNGYLVKLTPEQALRAMEKTDA